MRAHRATVSQPSLFGDGIPSAPSLPPSVASVFTPPPARARATDPETSHEAAEAIRSEADRQADEVLAMLTANPGLTSRELADQYHVDRYMVARRLPELRERGLVTTGAKRRCRNSQLNAMTWWPVAQSRDAAA